MSDQMVVKTLEGELGRISGEFYEFNEEHNEQIRVLILHKVDEGFQPLFDGYQQPITIEVWEDEVKPIGKTGV